VALSLGSQAGPGTADGPAKLNVAPRVMRRSEARLVSGATRRRAWTMNAKGKGSAHEKLVQYSRARKTQCVGMTTRGGWR
jgi:hypothetical protein